MTAQKGKDLLIKIGDGASPENFTTVAGLRATKLAFNAPTSTSPTPIPPTCGANCWPPA